MGQAIQMGWEISLCSQGMLCESTPTPPVTQVEIRDEILENAS